MPTAVITGAAGAIGRATVREFLDEGFDVIGLDIDPTVAESTSPTFKGYVVDLRESGATEQTLSRAVGSGSIDHLVTIAGGALRGEPETQDDPVSLIPAIFEESIRLNLSSHFFAVRAALPFLRRSPGDRTIALTSSFNALSGQGMPAYSAAKAGLIGLMNALTGPLGAEGIRINVVAPGTVRTPRTERLWAGHRDHWAQLEAATAIGRLGAPGDVAAVFLALATRLTHVTGQVLVVDGGQMTKRR